MGFEIPGFSSISSLFSGSGKVGGDDKAGETKGPENKDAKKPDIKSAGEETKGANGMMMIDQAASMMSSNVEGCKGQLEANVANSTETGKNAADQVKGDSSKNKDAKPAPATPSAAMPNPMMGA